MFTNYFKVAIRNLSRNKLLTFVNITGLSIGLACVILILLFVKDEWSFDRFHKNGDQIYRLVQTTTDTSGQERRNGTSGLPQGPVFAAAIPELANFCRINGWRMATKKGKEGIESQVLFADPSVFDIFSIDILKGKAAEMLQGRNALVLSADAAKKYFGNENPVGKTVEIEVDQVFEAFMVTGVVKTPPLNSSIQFDMLIPFKRQQPVDATELNSRMNDWNSLYLNTFFLLRKGADAKIVERKIWTTYLSHNEENWEKFKQRNGNTKLQFALQPFLSMHLDKQFFASNGLSNWSDSTYSYILSGLAALILLIACINFVNIALARSMQRSKEIGIRKVSGSSRVQVVKQFLSESLLVTTIAFIASLLLVQLALPFFNSIAGKQFHFAYLLQTGNIILFVGLILVVSLLAGFYPAFIASGFQPVQTLYGRFKLSGNNMLGKSLVVLQFAIAVALIIGTVIFNQQFSFISTAPLGYDAQNIIHLQFPWDKPAELRQFKNELAKEPFVLSVGTKSGNWNKTVFEINGKQTDWTYYETIDDQYLQTMQIPLAGGRYLSYANVADTVSNCMVNEAFVEIFLDKTINPIGQMIGGPGGRNYYHVIGVVKNYHSASFKEKIEPIFFSLDKSGDLLNTYVKYVPGKGKAVAAAIIQRYKAILPYSTLEYNYMEDWLMQRYQQDAQWKKIVSFSALVAVLIAALGLFALTTLSVQQRVKEIGIRKVLGASVTNIAGMLSKDFLKLILIAAVLAFPVAWWAMNKWLQNYSYRVEMGPWVFVFAIVLVLTIALFTVSLQAIKAAVANPVKSLRTE